MSLVHERRTVLEAARYRAVLDALDDGILRTMIHLLAEGLVSVHVADGSVILILTDVGNAELVETP